MLSFILNNDTINTNMPPGMTVLDFVRYHKQLTGTKIGCREGDCGACTILVGELQDDKVIYRSMTSCLMPLTNAHGKHIVTIEGINPPTGSLTPVQQALVEENGTQCGFCTVGFVVSLTGFCLQRDEPSFEQAISSVDGNICRCTGYKSIERASSRIVNLLQSQNGLEPISFAIDTGIVPPWFAEIKNRLSEIEQNTKESQLETTQNRINTLMSGGTDLYVQRAYELRHSPLLNVFDDTSLKEIRAVDDRIEIGGSVTVTDLLESPVMKECFPRLYEQMKLVSSTPIRNMATVAGNLVNASPIGDLTIWFLAMDSTVVLRNGEVREVPLRDFYHGYKVIDKMADEILVKIYFTQPDSTSHFNFEKVSKRTYLDIASVNTAIHLNVQGDVITLAHVSAGGVAPVPLYLKNTSSYLRRKRLPFDDETYREVDHIIQSEISPISDVRGSADYKRMLLRQLFLAHFVELFENDMTNTDAYGHVRGESIYLDDIPLIQNTLFARAFDSRIAHGVLKHIDFSEALMIPGVVRILTAKDIPGENQIGGIVPDEPLLADGHVHFQGMPIALIIATSEEIAHAAAKKIKVKIDPLEAITDPRVAFQRNELIIPPKKFKLGDTDLAFKECAHIFEGRTELNGQEHLYIETQGAYSVPIEGGGIKVYSSTQGPTAVQRTVARITGLPMHQVEVEVGRLGGGFGGKEDQASAWASLCALGTHLTGRPVKYSLHRLEDMRMTGKRNPYSSDYKIGLDADLRIKAYEVVFYQNAGAAADLSPSVLERTLFHCTNSYYVHHVTATAYSCRTNLPPNTAFRGFGGPQGMFVIESAIVHAAEKLNVSPIEIQKKNLIKHGEEFPYGQKAEREAVTTWIQADKEFDFEKISLEAKTFNEKSKYKKRGVAVMPVCFGISFTKTLMNQARALVHVYTDGSVAVSTGAVEMGQGVNTKMLQVAAQTFSLPPEKIKVHTTNTLRIANSSPTAASAAADLNGKATLMACETILNRLKLVAAVELNLPENDLIIKDGFVYHKNERTSLDWKTLINAAFVRRVNLSEHAHYSTPGIYFDWTTAKGHPFAYHVYGTAIVQVTVDCLRGIYEVDFVKCVHDFGKTMNTAIDYGQVEGGIVQGIGWMTMEEVVYDKTGRLLSNALSSYKIPDIYSVPKSIDILPLVAPQENLAIFSSKAVGEPPLMYGIGAYFAIRNAIRAFNPQGSPVYDAPFTPEKVLMNLYPSATPHPLKGGVDTVQKRSPFQGVGGKPA